MSEAAGAGPRTLAAAVRTAARRISGALGSPAARRIHDHGIFSGVVTETMP